MMNAAMMCDGMPGWWGAAWPVVMLWVILDRQGAS